jgi:hypothetical protein
MKRNLVIALLSLFASQGVFALDCTDNAVSAIVNLAEQINRNYSSPTVDIVQAIEGIALSCPETRVKCAAARVLALGMNSQYSSPTLAVSAVLSRICGANKYCALDALTSLAYGMNPHYSSPTETIARDIVKLVKAAPYLEVKSKAISVLSMGLNGNYRNPTRVCAEAIAEVGRCPRWDE